MIFSWRYGDEARRDDAAAWVVRLEAGDLGDADAVAFDAWLVADAGNGAAFDAALATSRTYSAAGQVIAEQLSRQRATAASDRTAARRRAMVGFGAVAAAATVAVLVAPQFAGPDASRAYATAKGERRTIQLADGSTVYLNGGTGISVSFARNARQVTLVEGQALFDVAHSASRPFLVTAGDRTIRVVGTQFDVRRLAGKVSITVARGAVEVRPTADGAGATYRLHPGQKLEHQEGAPTARVAAASPDEVLSWRSGRLVYRQQPLSEVVADLNQQFATPIRIDDPALAATPISGVLVLDDQAAVIRRLALLVPIREIRSGSAVVLKRDPASDR